MPTVLCPHQAYAPAACPEHVGSSFCQDPRWKPASIWVIDHIGGMHLLILLEFFKPSTFVLEYVSMMNSPSLLNDRYQIDGRIGSGGMAEVYRARDLMLERTVAIKLLREDFSDDPAFRERFRQEAKAAANLSHPNIVTIHDFGFDDKHIL